MMLILFWSAVAIIVYTYLLFPVIVVARGLFSRRTYRRAEITPPVSIIIAAHNEAEVIRAKLENLLALDYPSDCLEILIASDGSTDGTDEIVRSYAGQNIKLLSLPRQGKAPALNAAVAASSGEILVFSDANSMYAPDAIRALVRPFADPKVGGVAGNQCYRGKQQSSTSAGERSYWKFDRLLKQFQSRGGNAISATGAIYAIRRTLFKTVPVGVTDDFVTSTGVIAQGYRLVFAADAVAYEPVAASGRTEFGRKVRVITRGLQAVIYRRQLLNPFRHGFYALQLFSHKVLRRLVVFPLLIILLVNPLLWQHGLFYQAALLGQVVVYGCAGFGLLLAHTRVGRLPLFTVPLFFCMVNIASLIATLNIIRGHRISLWEPQRQEALERKISHPTATTLSTTDQR